MSEPDERVLAVEPAAVVRGSGDARLVLSLWCARRAFFPLLWLGLAIASVAILFVRDLGVDEVTREMERLADEGNLLTTLLSPFAGVAFALIWRLLVGLVALGAAYPLARRHELTRAVSRSRLSHRFRKWWDRLYLTRAYRAFRWTWAVRVAAAGIAPRDGSIADTCERILRWAGWGLFAAWIGTWVLAG